MNDDFDLDAQLRSGARAFPPGPTPDSGRLRDVLTTSRRRSRRTQGSVLACATAAVAGGAALALRDPQSTESVEVAGPASTSPGPTAPVTSSLPGSPWDWDTPIRDYLCTPDGLVRGEAPDDAQVLLITNGPEWDLSPSVVVTVEGQTVAGAQTPIDPASLVDGAPWTLLLGPGDEGVAAGTLLMVLPPFETPGPQEMTITAGGKTGTLRLLADPHEALVVPDVDPEGDLFFATGDVLEIGWSRLGTLCAVVPPAGDAEPDTTTSIVPDAPTTVPTTTPADPSDPEGPEGPEGPTTTVTVLPTTGLLSEPPPTTVPGIAPPTTVP